MMGKSNRKLQRKQKQGRKETVVNSSEFMEIVNEIRKYKEQGQYNEALESVIQSFEKFGVKSMTAYEAAEAYYLSGDYERTALWCENTLKLDIKHAGALILLARLAILRDQLENALALLDKVCAVSNAEFDLWREDLQELLDVILIDYETELARKKYPLLWKSLDLEPELKEIKEEKGETSECKMEPPAAKDEPKAATELETVEQMQGDIMALPISLKEKAVRCNEVAVEYYEQGNLDFALAALKLALAIDRTDELTLRNTGFLLLKLGNEVEAKECFSRLHDPDLMVLQVLKAGSL